MKYWFIFSVLLMGCSVNLDISTKQSEKWCIKECKKYDYPEIILAPMLIGGYESPQCICMTDCMNLDSTYCIKK